MNPDDSGMGASLENESLDSLKTGGAATSSSSSTSTATVEPNSRCSDQSSAEHSEHSGSQLSDPERSQVPASSHGTSGSKPRRILPKIPPRHQSLKSYQSPVPLYSHVQSNQTDTKDQEDKFELFSRFLQSHGDDQSYSYISHPRMTSFSQTNNERVSSNNSANFGASNSSLRLSTQFEQNRHQPNSFANQNPPQFIHGVTSWQTQPQTSKPSGAGGRFLFRPNLPTVVDESPYKSSSASPSPYNETNSFRRRSHSEIDLDSMEASGMMVSTDMNLFEEQESIYSLERDEQVEIETLREDIERLHEKFEHLSKAKNPASAKNTGSNAQAEFWVASSSSSTTSSTQFENQAPGKQPGNGHLSPSTPVPMNYKVQQFPMDKHIDSSKPPGAEPRINSSVSILEREAHSRTSFLKCKINQQLNALRQIITRMLREKLQIEDEITTCDSSDSLEKFEQDLEEIELTQKQITKLVQKLTGINQRLSSMCFDQSPQSELSSKEALEFAHLEQDAMLLILQSDHEQQIAQMSELRRQRTAAFRLQIRTKGSLSSIPRSSSYESAAELEKQAHNSCGDDKKLSVEMEDASFYGNLTPNLLNQRRHKSMDNEFEGQPLSYSTPFHVEGDSLTSSPFVSAKFGRGLDGNSNTQYSWQHIRDPKLHRAQAQAQHNLSTQSDEHGSDNSCGKNWNEFSDWEPKALSRIRNEQMNKSCDDSHLSRQNGSGEVDEVNGEKTNASNREGILKQSSLVTSRDLSPSIAEESLILRQDTLWQNEHGELYRLLCPKNDLQGNELRSAKRKLARENSVGNPTDEDYLSDSGWKSDSELVVRERKVTFSEKPPEVNRIPPLSSPPEEPSVVAHPKKRTKSIKRKLQKLTRDLENTLKFSIERSSTMPTSVGSSYGNAFATTHGSRFVLSQLQASPVRVNNWALHGEEPDSEPTPAPNHSYSDSRRASRDPSPASVSYQPNYDSLPSRNQAILETSFFNPQKSNNSSKNLDEANSVSHPGSPLEFNRNSAFPGNNSSNVPPEQLLSSPFLPKNRSCYYRLIGNNSLEVFYPDTNQIFRYKCGTEPDSTDHTPAGNQNRHLGTPDASIQRVSSGYPNEWKSFGGSNVGGTYLRPHLGTTSNLFANSSNRNSPQWMSKLVDKRSSVDAEFHTRFPVPAQHPGLNLPSLATKSPSKKKSFWISSKSSTINSVFDIVKQKKK